MTTRTITYTPSGFATRPHCADYGAETITVEDGGKPEVGDVAWLGWPHFPENTKGRVAAVESHVNGNVTVELEFAA